MEKERKVMWERNGSVVRLRGWLEKTSIATVRSGDWMNEKMPSRLLVSITSVSFVALGVRRMGKNDCCSRKAIPLMNTRMLDKCITYNSKAEKTLRTFCGSVVEKR